MSHQLAAIAYADLATAERVREELVDATREGRAQLEDAVVVERTLDDEIKLHQFNNAAAKGAAAGAAGGALIGLLFLAPLLGMAVGAASGALVERLKPYGGIVVHSSLSTSDERRLQAALAEGAATVRGST